MRGKESNDNNKLKQMKEKVPFSGLFDQFHQYQRDNQLQKYGSLPVGPKKKEEKN